jgi:hypothetical protein
MQRFRLLGFYVVGVVAVIGLAVLGASMKRTPADAGTPPASDADAEPSPSGPDARESSLTSATTGAASAVKASIRAGNAKCTGLTKAEAEDLLDWLEAHAQLGKVSYQEGKGFRVQ